MSIKFNGSSISDVKVCQNGSLVNVNKIMQNGSTIWTRSGDRNLKYVESTNGTAWTELPFRIYPNTVEDIVEICCEVPDHTGDCKFLGQGVGAELCMCTYSRGQTSSGWRPFMGGDFYNDLWSTYKTSEYQKVLCRCTNDPNGTNTGSEMTLSGTNGSVTISLDRIHNVSYDIDINYSFGVGRVSRDLSIYGSGDMSDRYLVPTFRFNHFKRWINGVQVMNVVPKIIDGVPLLRDTVTNTSYPSKSDTPFTAGPYL